MKFEMYFENYTNETPLNYEELFELIAKKTFSTLLIKGKLEFSVSIVDGETIQKYNREYRKIDRITDVLSFAFNDFEDKIILKNQPKMLGDIIICYEQAAKQALEYQHSLKREIAFLFVHGLLHLLGYDHIETTDEKVMFALQDFILEKLKIRKE